MMFETQKKYLEQST